MVVGSVWMRSLFQLRSRRRATLGMILVVGLGASVVLAGLAGARRSEDALRDFFASSQPAHVLVYLYRDNLGDPAAPPFALPEEPDELTGALEQIRALPHVERAFRGTEILIGEVDAASPSGYRPRFAHMHLDPGGSDVFGQPLIVAGRLARDDEPDEVVIDEQFAELHGLQVGSSYRAASYSRQQTADVLMFAPVAPAHATRDLRVVGIVRGLRDVLPPVTDQTASYVIEDEIYLTPAYYAAHGGDLPLPGVLTGVRLRNGFDDVEQLSADITRLFGATAEVAPFRSVGGNLGQEEKRSLEQSISYEANGLRIFAALVAIALLVFVGQTSVRQNAAEGEHDRAFRTLGMTGRQLVLSTVLRWVPIAVGGAAVAVSVATALSPLAPVGAARRAVLDRGVAVDSAVLLPGAAIIMAAVLALAALAVVWHLRSRTTTTARRVGIVARLGAGAPPPVAVGTGFALNPGRGTGAVPSRPAMAAASVAVVGLLMAGVVLASYDGLASSPGRFGANWDVQVGLFQLPGQAEEAEPVLAGDPDVAGYAGVRAQAVLIIDGRDVSAMALVPAEGGVPVEVLSGRAPTAIDEIGLGAVTMRRLGLSVGDRVEVTGGEAPAATMRVTGNVVIPAGGVDYELGPGKGALVTPEVLATRYPATAYSQSFVIDLVEGVDPRRKAAELEASFPDTVLVVPLPAELRNLRQVRELPVALAAVVGVLAITALVHALTTVTRRRRRDLAVLKTIGFTRRQLSATVAWQSMMIATVGIAIGLPLGLAGGRWLWQFVSDQLGVVPHPVVPPAFVAVVVVATLVVANVVAALPAWLAGRIPAAVVLRHDS